MKCWFMSVTTCVACVLIATGSGAAVDLLYTLERTANLPSTDTDWDYIKLEPGSSRLFMARARTG